MNKALESAKAKGAKAAREGLPRSAVPYLDKRTVQGFNTFSRAFIHAWYDGYDAQLSLDACPSTAGSSRRKGK